MHPSKKLLTIASAAVLGMALSLPAYAQTNSESLGPAFANLEQKADTQESDSVLSKTTYTKANPLESSPPAVTVHAAPVLEPTL